MPESTRAGFYRFFHKKSRVVIFHENFMLFSEKMHLRTYGLGNDFLCNYQTTVGFLAKNADFGVLGLKITKFGDFMEKLVYASQITIFRPRSPTINNPQGILMVWGVAGAEKCKKYLNFMIL